METKVISISGKNIPSRVRIVSGKRMDTSTDEDRESQPFWVASIDGITGILREDAVNDLKNGNMYEFNYTVEKREVQTDEGPKEVENFRYVGHSTYKQMINVAKNETMLSRIEAEFKLPDNFMEKEPVEEVEETVDAGAKE